MLELLKSIGDSIAENLKASAYGLLEEAFKAGQEYQSWRQAGAPEGLEVPDFKQWAAERFK
jgi:predicted transcriptional regulator